MKSSRHQVTRGCGLLERFLSRQRANIATKLIGDSFSEGRILDIGCGSQPYFLSRIRIAKKYGIDNLVDSSARDAQHGIHLSNHNIEVSRKIPFEDSFFDVVTMLAVFEHIEPSRLPETLNDITRTLKPGGVFVMTTPAGWTDKLLRFLAKINLVSSEEIDEHKDAYSHSKIKSIIELTDLKECKIQYGYFELGMNLWVKVVKKS